MNIPQTLIDANNLKFTEFEVQMSSNLIDLLISSKERLLRNRINAAVTIQCSYKMCKSRTAYRNILHKLKKIQSIIRMSKEKKLFRRKKFAVQSIKSVYLVKYYRTRFLAMKAAALVIQIKFSRLILPKLRYKRMRKAVIMFQEMSRGLILKKEVDRYIHCAYVIKKAILSYLRRYLLVKYSYRLAITVQRLFRGFIWRNKNNRIVRVLGMRKRQRIAHKVITKIQSHVRRRSVQSRFRVVVRATKAIQSFIRCIVGRKRFLVMKFLAIWLQACTRRLQATKKVDGLRSFLMIQSELHKLSNAKQLELKGIPPSASAGSLGCIRLGTEIARNARDNLTRFALALDITVDLESYPQGWLRTMTKFAESLQKVEKKSISKIALGCEHTVIVDDYSNVYTFGTGDEGQLGHGNRKNRMEPCLVETLERATAGAGVGVNVSANVRQRIEVLDVACGRFHTLLLAASGRLYSWGGNLRGQLGHSNFESCALPRLVGAECSVGVLKYVKQISCGAYHSVCIADPGYVYTWGASHAIGRSKIPTTLILDKDKNSWLMSASASNNMYKGLLIHQEDFQDLDDGASASVSADDCQPAIPPYFQKRRVQMAVSGENFITVKSGSELLSWGRNSQGQLGNGSFVDSNIPQRVKVPRCSAVELEAAILKCGGKHSIFQIGSQVWCWGYNKFGQIGNGTTNDAPTPHNVKFPNSAGNNIPLLFSHIDAGWTLSIAKLSSGKIYTWGSINLISDFARFPVARSPSVLAVVTDSNSGSAKGGSRLNRNQRSSISTSNGLSTGTAVPSYLSNRVFTVATGLIISPVFPQIQKISTIVCSSMSIITVFCDTSNISSSSSSEEKNNNSLHTDVSNVLTDTKPFEEKNNISSSPLRPESTQVILDKLAGTSMSTSLSASIGINKSKGKDTVKDKGKIPAAAAAAGFNCFLSGRDARRRANFRDNGDSAELYLQKCSMLLGPSPSPSAGSGLYNTTSNSTMMLQDPAVTRNSSSSSSPRKLVPPSSPDVTLRKIDDGAMLKLFTPIHKKRKDDILLLSSSSANNHSQSHGGLSFDRRKRGVNMPKSDRMILSKIADQRKALEVKSIAHLFTADSASTSHHQRVNTGSTNSPGPGPTRKQSFGSFSRGSLRMSMADMRGTASKVQFPEFNGSRRGRGLGLEEDLDASVIDMTPGYAKPTSTSRSLNSAIDSLRRDIKRMESDPSSREEISYEKKKSVVEGVTSNVSTSSFKQQSRLYAPVSAAMKGVGGAKGKGSAGAGMFSYSSYQRASDNDSSVGSETEISRVRDLAVLIQNIKKESLEKASGGIWRSNTYT